MNFLRSFIFGAVSALACGLASAQQNYSVSPSTTPIKYASQSGISCSGNSVDVTASIQAWITANVGLSLVLPNGVCGTSAPLVVPANTVLTGGGIGITKIDASVLGVPGMGPVVKLNGANALARDFTAVGNGAGTKLASGISLGATSLTVASATGWPTSGTFQATIFADGANSTETITVSAVSGTTWTTTATTSAHAINALVQSPRLDDGVLVANGANNSKVLNVETSGAGDNGIETQANDTEIAFSYPHGSFTNGIYHIGATGSHVISYRARIHDNTLANNSVFSTTCSTTASPSCWDGIDIDPLTNNDLVENNYVGDNDIILFETDAAWATKSSGHQVIGNKIVNSVAGCLTAAGFIDNFVFLGNQCINTTGNAIGLHGPTTNGQIESNKVYGSTGDCVYAYSQATGTFAGISDKIAISDNECTNTVSGGGGTNSAIKIQDAATNIWLFRNRVLGTNGGVYAIDASSAANSVIIAGNWPLTVGSTGYINTTGSQPLLGQPGGGSGSMIGGIASATNIGNMGSNSFAWGQSSFASGSNSCAFGFVNTADTTFACAQGGNAWNKGRYGFFAHASGDFSANGDAQDGWTVLRGQGTCSGGTVTIRATADGGAASAINIVNLKTNNYVQQFHHMTIKDDTAVNYVGYTLLGQGAYRSAGGTVTLDGTNAPAWVKGSANGATATAWSSPTITGDDTSKGINVSWTNATCTNGDVYSIVDRVFVVEH